MQCTKYSEDEKTCASSVLILSIKSDAVLYTFLLCFRCIVWLKAELATRPRDAQEDDAALLPPPA